MWSARTAIADMLVIDVPGFDRTMLSLEEEEPAHAKLLMDRVLQDLASRTLCSHPGCEALFSRSLSQDWHIQQGNNLYCPLHRRSPARGAL